MQIYHKFFFIVPITATQGVYSNEKAKKDNALKVEKVSCNSQMLILQSIVRSLYLQQLLWRLKSSGNDTRTYAMYQKPNWLPNIGDIKVFNRS